MEKRKAMESEEERWEKKKKRSKEMPSQIGRRRKNYVKLEKDQQNGSAGVSLCLVMFLARNAAKWRPVYYGLCVNELIYFGRHPCTRDIPPNGPAATPMRWIIRYKIPVQWFLRLKAGPGCRSSVFNTYN
jgi:hypothetical protein